MTTIELDGTATRRFSLALIGAGAVYAVSPVHLPLPCPLLTLTGVPCPLCGMTRAVTAVFRGDFIASLRYNPGGILLIIVALALLLRRSSNDLRIVSWLIPAALAALWVWNIGFNPTFT